MRVPEAPDRRFLVAADMEKYSRQDNLSQWAAQQTFQEVMRRAVTTLGLNRVDWTTQQGGDGELAILPAGTPEPTVVAHLVPAIERLLREHNRRLLPEAKVRLRVALHQGLVHLDGANGFPGEAIVQVCRLRDSAPPKKALAAFPHASVVLIVSEHVFRDIVRHGYGGLRPERFARVEVSMPDKEFAATAWVYVPDEDANQVIGLDDRSPEPATSVHPEPAAPAGPVPGGDTYHVGNTNGPTHFGPGGVVIGTFNAGGSGE